MLDKGIRLSNSDAQAPSIADFVVGNVLANLQRYPERLQAQADRRWQFFEFRELGRTAWLIVGYGNIGREVARRLKGFGASVTGLRRTPAPDEFADRIGTLDDLDAHLSDSDVVLLCCALNDSTRGLVDARFLGRMKPGSILVNVGRGGLVDEPALIAALDDDRLAHVVLDVFATEPLPNDSALWTHPKVLVSSHTSGFGDGLQERGDALFLDNLARYLAGEPLRNEVTRP
jgi:phosphoglycerate dehydrogenase-like enzyme